jgi:DNA-binding response OmpR family regulator
MHVLIIEDDFLTAMFLAELLADLGFSSHDFAATEADAVAAARRRCPDLITADVRLQAGSGIAAVRAICSERRMPVIYVTASPGEVAHLPDAIVVDKPISEFYFRIAVNAAQDLRE